MTLAPGGGDWPPVYHKSKDPGSQTQFGHFWEDKNLLPLPGIETPFLGLPNPQLMCSSYTGQQNLTFFF